MNLSLPETAGMSISEYALKERVNAKIKCNIMLLYFCFLFFEQD